MDIEKEKIEFETKLQYVGKGRIRSDQAEKSDKILKRGEVYRANGKPFYKDGIPKVRIDTMKGSHYLKLFKKVD